MKVLRTLAALAGLLFILVAHASQNAWSAEARGAAAGEEDDFDRLDGTGTSGVKAQFIEWEGNAEIHVYPKGALAGLGLKLVKNEKGSYVFVIGYRFSYAPKQVLIRRNVLSDKWVEGYKTYRAPSDSDYDKIVISPNTLSGMTTFKLDPPPTQMFPDGHPALAQPPKAPAEEPSVAKPLAKKSAGKKAARESESAESAGHERPTASDEGVDEAGTLRPFFSEPRGRANQPLPK